jgi:transcriptional regulator with XRE-family HTH domain
MDEEINVAAERKKYGLTQQELADQTGISRDKIAKWERNKGSPKVADSRTLTEFFRKRAIKETQKTWDKVPKHYAQNEATTQTSEIDETESYVKTRNRTTDCEREISLLQEHLSFAKDQNKYLQTVIDRLLNKGIPTTV